MEEDWDDDTGTSLSRRYLLQGSMAALAALGAGGLVSDAEAARVVSANTAATPGGTTTAAGYILRRLKQFNVTTLFGVPGKTCEALYVAAAAEGMGLAVTSSDLEAGYAADGYARMRGLGAVAVTYGVGTLSLLNAIAGAYTEKSPVVIINGGPNSADLDFQNTNDVRFTHSVGRLGALDGERDARRREALTDIAAFRPFTVYAERVTAIAKLAEVVDGAIQAALRQSRPVYIEIARSVWGERVASPTKALAVAGTPAGSEAAIAKDIVDRLLAADKPVLLLGSEITRCGLADAAAALIARLGLPWATTLLAKSAIAETASGFLGVYDSSDAPAAIRQTFREADLIVGLGTILGVWHRHLVASSDGGVANRLIRVSNGAARLGSKPPRRADLVAVMGALAAADWAPSAARRQAHAAWRDGKALAGLSFDQRRGLPRRHAASAQGVSYDDIMGTISDGLDASFVTLADTTLALYQAPELNVSGRNSFVCNAVWQSIGYSVGAAVGVGVAEKESGGRRPLVICGDGGFQMMAQGLSTLARRGIRAIVVILDNGTYGIEQHLISGTAFSNPAEPILPFVQLQRWNYAELARAMGVASAVSVDTAVAFAAAFAAAKSAPGAAVIAVRVPPRDRPSELG